jgi:hypothetical protein
MKTDKQNPFMDQASGTSSDDFPSDLDTTELDDSDELEEFSAETSRSENLTDTYCWTQNRFRKLLRGFL